MKKEITLKRFQLIVWLIFLTFLGLIIFFILNNYTPEKIQSKIKIIMKISSSDFEENWKIPEQFTCDSENINPELTITNIPANTKTLAITMQDSDSLTEKPWVHWTLWNIPSATSIKIERWQIPLSIQQWINDFEKIWRWGPCPPKWNWPHRYFFKVYAIDIALDLSQNSNFDELTETIKNHIITKSELMWTYERK